MPNNWKTYKLGDLVDVNSNQIKKDEFDWINYIDIKSVGTGFYETPQKINFNNAPSRARRKLKNGDTVISSVRPNLKSFFYCREIPENAVASTGFVVLNSEKLDSRFLYYLTTNDNYINYLVQSCSGSAYPAFSPNVILESEVFIPDFPEQQSIASILSAIDDKIENNLAINKTLEVMAMALYKHWFVDFGPFQDGEFVESELGLIPKGWEVKPFLELFQLLSGGTPKTTIESYWNGDIYWVSAKDIGSNNGGSYINDTEKKITKLGIDKSAAKILPEDTVIVVARGSVGKFGIISKPMAINQSCYGIYSKSDYSQALTYLLIQSLMNHFMNVSYGSVFDTITTSTFQNIKVLVPSKEVFEEIKKEVDVNFKQIKENIKENQTLTQLRDTLLPKLISGEVRLKEFREN
jgi:type I restriction enzyme S subunit